MGSCSRSEHVRSKDSRRDLWPVVENGGDAPVEQNDNAVAQAQQFIEIGAHEQHGATALRHFVDAAVQEGSCRNINAARRLVGDQEFRIGSKFTRGNQLLRIAAGKGIEPFGDGARAHRILPYHAADARLDGAPVQKRPPENLPVGGD